MCSALVRNDRLERHMRKVHDISSARSETNIQPKPNQNIKQTRIKYSNIWFVLHQSGLYNVNQNIIGFRDPSESRMIKRDHIIFYYRSSPYQQIMGIYKVIRSAEGIDKNFRIMTETKSEYLPYQHELELVYPLRRHFGTDEHNRLHFYSRLHNKNRWDNMHVFSMTRGDVELIADQFSNEVLRLLSV